MTDKPTPKEIDLLVRTYLGDCDPQANRVYSFVTAVLAKWGQPDQKTVTVAPATGDMWLKHDDDLRYVRRVLEAGRQMTDVDQGAAIDMVQALRVTIAIHVSCDAATPECLTCSGHGAVGNILTAEPCPDCTHWNVQPAQARAAESTKAISGTQKQAICDACGSELLEVLQSPNSYLSAEQFDADKLGDWYCKCCPKGPSKGSSTHRYFWNRDLGSTAAQAAAHVAWLSPWRKDQVTTDYDAYGEQGIPLVVAQQPVARVPLTEACRLFAAGWKAAALFCDREDVVADGIIGFGACPQFEAAFSAAQPVAREPLTNAQREKIIEAVDWYNFPQDVIDAVERAHGIKGGQHG